MTSGSRTLKDAVNEAMREWVATVDTTHYCLGSVMGPHPFPYMVRQFQRVVGDEARAQCRTLLDGADPDVVVACIGGGSNAAGTFAGFVDTAARLVGVEAAGGAAVTNGIPGVLHGMYSRLLQDEAGQIEEAVSISAGLDYPGLGPEHAHLASIGRAEYSTANDAEVLDAFRLLSHTEGIIPALESAHAIAWVARNARTDALPAGSTVLVTLPAGATRTWRRSARSSGAAMPDLEKELRESRGARPQAPHPVPDGRHDRRLGADAGGGGRRRRRRRRGGHPVLRPDDGRARDPGGGAPCPAPRNRSRQRARRHRASRSAACPWP